MQAFEQAAAAVDEAHEAGHVPGAVLLAGDDDTTASHTVGVAQRAGTLGCPADRPLTADTWFDLASLTKVLVTLPCVLLLVADGVLDLDAPVRERLPGFGDARVTSRQLLSHSSGLPAHRDFWLADRAVPDAALAEPLEAPPGTRVGYSDLGFLILGVLVGTVSGQPLDDVWRRRVARPLALVHSGFRPAVGTPVAATEPPPGGPDRVGIVHDENARAAGGVAGHAGLFGTADDVASYVRRGWLSDDLLPAALRAEAVTCQTDGLDGRRGLGWTLRGDRWDHMGQRWPRTAAGHTGFTGTCVAFDPPTRRWVVLLTNAVHAGRERAGIAALRRLVHDTLWADGLS